ncbi:FMN-binding protein [Actinospica sp. MGRD01-02]|uniref:FMN-binding protein n=1 Tax=Actinospica acidithermotolerans TaxID=2828514 RepID=A0A941IFH4_9ACTN|nr:FMN-binding protein [Actinospica acidithermotolerans]MBR7825044.1 FMN-binding protein [Actinospica acidithermotolerans]
MRRAIIAGTATVSGVVLLLGIKGHPDTAAASTPIGLSANSGATSSTGSTGSSGSSGSTGSTSTAAGSGSPTASSPSATSSPSAAASTSAAAKNYTGSAVDTRYGPIQVEVTMSGKKITNIEVLEYPENSDRDQQINSYALPQLNQEAMTAQSAQIDAISGATYTSEGYIQSLQSALDQAG